MYNIFEEPILSIRPVATEIKRLMLENGAIGAMMSGSGPSVFGIFEDAQSTNSAANAINALGIATHLCEPVGATII
jgi:4-diphosphocytidyl-2-C-methyl-D-erythritol kinase